MAFPISNWTKEREETLAKMWSEGSSCRQIGVELDVSRNSVIGKIHRLGLSAPLVKKPFTKKKRAKRSSASHDNTIYNLERVKNWHRVRRTTQREEHVLRCIEIECTTTFEDLNGCRYPVGDGPFLFCNGPQMGGRSYCVNHAALCFQPPRILTDKAPLREVA